MKKARTRMVSCPCTSRIPGDFRSTLELQILCSWMASSICCLNVGYKAEKTKKSQKKITWHDFSCSAMGVEAEHAFVRVVCAIALLGSGQETAQRESRDESPNMGPPRDAPTGGGQQELHH